MSKSSQPRKLVTTALFALVLMLGLVFLASVQPALASAPAQVPTATRTATVGAGGTGGTTGGGGATLAAPSGGVGQATSLVPVTGADLSQSDQQPKMLVRLTIALVGLILIGIGIRSRVLKH